MPTVVAAPQTNVATTAAWSKVAAWRRRLDFGLCQDCLRLDLLALSSLVDHIVPIYVRPDWRLDIGNTQVLCVYCHRRKTSADLRRYGHRDGVTTLLQKHNRQQSQQLIQPPSADENPGNDEPVGGSQSLPPCAENQTPPDARFSAKLGWGGSEGLGSIHEG